MCYIWQEQSWELTLEVTTSQTALSQRRDNTLFGGGDVQNDHFIGHDDYVWENKTPWWRPPCLVRPCSRPCDHLWFESMKQDNGSKTQKVENYPKYNTYCNAFFYIPGFKTKLNACELKKKVFLWKKRSVDQMRNRASFPPSQFLGDVRGMFWYWWWLWCWRWWQSHASHERIGSAVVRRPFSSGGREAVLWRCV